MGNNECKAQTLQWHKYTQKKRQSHPILGEIVLVHNSRFNTFHTIKHIPGSLFEQYKSLCGISSTLDRNSLSLCCNSQEVDQLRTMISAFDPKQMHNNKKNYIQILQIKQRNKKSFLMPSCAVDQSYTVIFDSLEVDLETIQFSKNFVKFQELHFVNIIICALQGIITLQNQNIGVYPICKKSIVLQTNSDDYLGQNLSTSTFKVIPINLASLPFQRCYHQNNCIHFVPPQLEEGTDRSEISGNFHFIYAPKNHIYCLGMMIVDLIYEQERSHFKENRLDFSFGNLAQSNKNNFQEPFSDNLINKSKHKVWNKLQVLENSTQFSQKFIQIIKMMIQKKQQDRIGLSSLYQICNILKQKKTQSFRATKLTARQFYTIQKNCGKRNIVSKNHKPVCSNSSKSTNLSCQVYLAKQQIKIQNNIFKNILNKSVQIHKQMISQNQQLKKRKCINSLSNAMNQENKFPELIDVNEKSDKIQHKKYFQPSYMTSTTLIATNGQYEGLNYQKGNHQLLKQEIKNHKKNAERIIFQNGAIYQGQLNQYRNFQGFGTLYYSQNQICYTGYWKNNQFHGFGYLYNRKLQAHSVINYCEKPLLDIYLPKNQQYQQNGKQSQMGVGYSEKQINYRDFSLNGSNQLKQNLWEHYQGQFKFDKKHGYGILYFIDGSKFQGIFKANKANGSGNFSKTNGKRVNGIWKNNILVKQIGIQNLPKEDLTFQMQK